MTLHQTIKDEIKDAMRAKDTIRLDTLRGLNALFLNEMLASKPTVAPTAPAKMPASPPKSPTSAAPAKSGTPAAPVKSAAPATSAEFLPDDKALPLVKRSVKQRKDSIEQFEKGGRKDLADKEKAELKILKAFLPATMSRDEIKIAVSQRIDALKSQGAFDPKSASLSAGQAGKITGMIMKELSGKADGADVKAAVDEVIHNLLAK